MCLSHLQSDLCCPRAIHLSKKYFFHKKDQKPSGYTEKLSLVSPHSKLDLKSPGGENCVGGCSRGDPQSISQHLKTRPWLGGRWIWFKPGSPARALTLLRPGLVVMSKAKDSPKGKMLRNPGDTPNFAPWPGFHFRIFLET